MYRLLLHCHQPQPRAFVQCYNLSRQGEGQQTAQLQSGLQLDEGQGGLFCTALGDRLYEQRFQVKGVDLVKSKHQVQYEHLRLLIGPFIL